jgi:hypothetical protein
MATERQVREGYALVNGLEMYRRSVGEGSRSGGRGTRRARMRA